MQISDVFLTDMSERPLALIVNLTMLELPYQFQTFDGDSCNSWKVTIC